MWRSSFAARRSIGPLEINCPLRERHAGGLQPIEDRLGQRARDAILPRTAAGEPVPQLVQIEEPLPCFVLGSIVEQVVDGRQARGHGLRINVRQRRCRPARHFDLANVLPHVDPPPEAMFGADKCISVVLSMTKASSGVASATAASNCCSVLAASADRRDISGPSFRTSRADRTAQRPVAGWEANSSSCDKRVSGSGQANGGLTSTAAGFGPDACGATALGRSSKIASPGGLPFFSPSSAATAVPALAGTGPAAGSGLGWDTDSERD